MLSTEKQGLGLLAKIALPYGIASLVYVSLVFLLEEIFGDHIYQISGNAGAVFGLAVAFFLGFRMNSAYDRWWEARKILGELTNNTRSILTKLSVYFDSDANTADGVNGREKAKELIRLVRQYVRSLHNELGPSRTEEDWLISNESREKYGIEPGQKHTSEVLHALSREIEESISSETIAPKMDLMQLVNRFYDIQGKAERIRNTPFLMVYNVFMKIIVVFYVMLIPFFVGDLDPGGEESYMEFLAIPILVLISTSFFTIYKLANLYGEPFSKHKTSVPLQAISRNLENECQRSLDRLA